MFDRYVMEALEILVREGFEIPSGSVAYRLIAPDQPDSALPADPVQPLEAIVYIGTDRTLNDATHSVDFYKKGDRVAITKWRYSHWETVLRTHRSQHGHE